MNELLEKLAAIGYQHLDDLVALVGKLSGLGHSPAKISKRIGSTAVRALRNRQSSLGLSNVSKGITAAKAPVATAAKGGLGAAGSAGAVGKRMSGPDFAAMMEPYKARIRYARGA